MPPPSDSAADMGGLQNQEATAERSLATTDNTITKTTKDNFQNAGDGNFQVSANDNDDGFGGQSISSVLEENNVNVAPEGDNVTGVDAGEQGLDNNNSAITFDIEQSKDFMMQGHHHIDDAGDQVDFPISSSSAIPPHLSGDAVNSNSVLLDNRSIDDQNYGFDESDDNNSMDGSNDKGGLGGFHSNGVSKAKAPFVSNWLESNYEAFEGVSLPRSTLYAHYLERCRISNVEPVNAASFGKIIRAVFPNLKTRRLGTRGNSKYHYYGIKLRSDPITGLGMDGNMSAARAGETKVSAPKPRSGSKKARAEAAEEANLMASRGMDKNGYGNANADEFVLLLQEHCVPIHVNIPAHISPESLQEFCHLYQNHCQRIISLLAMKEFVNFDLILKQFWQSLNAKMIPSLNCEEACRIIGVTDDLLHHTIIQMLLGNVLEPINLTTTQQIRHFAKNLESWLLQALDGFPMSIVDVKIDSAKRFTHVLRRRTSLNHLAQAARTVLQNPEQVHQMLQDWNQIDFESVKEQASWIVLCRDNIFESVEESFRTYLGQGVALEFWAEWLEGIVDQCLTSEASGGEVVDPNQLHPSVIETAARQFLLKWSFFSTLIMRDLTLRSASSFGSFHLMRLLYDEYIFYIVERRLEDVKRRLYEEHWNTEAAAMMQQVDHFGTMAGNVQAFSTDMNRNMVVAGRLAPQDQFQGGKEVFDDYTTVYFGNEQAATNNGNPSAITASFTNSERNLEGATSRMGQMMNDGSNEQSNSNIQNQGSERPESPRKGAPRPDDGNGGYATHQKKKIRVDSSLAAILNCN